MYLKIIIIAVALSLSACSAVTVDLSRFSADEIANLRVTYKAGTKFTTTKTFTSIEELENLNNLSIYRFEKYETQIHALDSNRKPIAGSRHYLDAFYELTSGESIKRNKSKYDGKTVYFKPGQPPTIDDSIIEKEEADALRLTGFEDLFLPEKVVKNNTEIVYQLPKAKEQHLKHFLRMQGVLPDKSDIFIKLLEMADTKDLGITWKFSLRWDVSGLLVSSEPRGIRMELTGMFIFSEKLANITYFELSKNSTNEDKSSFLLMITRIF